MLIYYGCSVPLGFSLSALALKGRALRVPSFCLTPDLLFSLSHKHWAESRAQDTASFADRSDRNVQSHEYL